MNYAEAEARAIEAHRGQRDKGGRPYIQHPLAVARAVWSLGEDARVVGVTHDVWEDTEAGLPGLTSVQAEALDALTRRPGETYRAFRERTREVGLARVVGIADIRHNRSPERRLPEPEASSMEKRYAMGLEILEVTREEVEAARTERGGWTRDSLARWGIPWPPPKGWRKLIEPA